MVRLNILSQDKVQTGNSAVSQARTPDNWEYSPESACCNWNDPIGTFASRDMIEPWHITLQSLNCKTKF